MRILILGAAGRDFHDFLVLYKDDPNVEVVAFTAAQIPFIDDRRFPAALAGERYPAGIPITTEDQIERLIAEENIDAVVFAYSDVTDTHVAALAARANAAGADFILPGARAMVPSNKPVIGVGAIRTGCGKSQTTRYLLALIEQRGFKSVGIRHPMPYGDLVKQRVQRFATRDDLDRHLCTVEEREEYEPYVNRGRVVYAGVDYAAIVAEAEKEADLIFWDGGNNDLPLVKPDLLFVLMDPHRSGDAVRYYPSQAQVRMADVILIPKSHTATKDEVAAEVALARQLNPTAKIIKVASRLTVEGGLDLAGKRVVCVEDGPTTTHGGMKYGAALLAARRAGAVIVDPRPHMVGELAKTYAKYPDIGPLVPAMGYSDQQIADLQATLEAVDAELVLSGSPIELAKLIDPGKPIVTVGYDLEEIEGEPALGDVLDEFIAAHGLS